MDVGEHYLNYEVVAHAADATKSHVVDFGIWPEQDYPRTSKHNYRRDLQEVYKRGDKWDRLHDAVLDALKEIITRPYFDSDGNRVDMDAETRFIGHAHGGAGARYFKRFALIGVDAGDGETAPAVWDAIADFHRMEDGRFFGRAVPCYGGSAATRLMRFYDLKPGEWRRGGNRAASTCDWIENPASRAGELSKYAGVVPTAFCSTPTRTSRDVRTHGARRSIATARQRYLMETTPNT